MFINSKFTINGISSVDIDVGAVLVRTNGSFLQEQMMGARTVNQDKPAKNELPTLYGIDQDVIEFDLKLVYKDLVKFTTPNLTEMAKHFGGLTFVPFTTEEYPGIVFYVLATSMHVIKTGEYKGWLEIHLVTSAPFAFFEGTTEVFNVLTSGGGNIVVYNDSNVMNPKYNDFIYDPIIEIDINEVLAGDLILTNTSNGNKTFSFTGLEDFEQLWIDNRLRKIISNEATLPNRINNLVDKQWLQLVYGENIININKKATVTFTMQQPVYV